VARPEQCDFDPSPKGDKKHMYLELQQRLDYLETLEEPCLNLCQAMLTADDCRMFPVDILAAATIKRSLSLIQGFTILIKSSNYICAASLLRLQLDSCLRLFALFIVERPHDVATQVLKGIPIRDIKDRNGKRMTDRHLVDTLSGTYPWMGPVYDSTSGYIHLSRKHLLSIFEETQDHEDGTMNLRIAADDDNVPVEAWIELTEAFIAATNALFEYLTGWAVTKENPDAVASSASDPSSIR